MEPQWVLDKAGCCYCPLYLQKTINPHSSLPWWLLVGPVIAAQGSKRLESKSWKNLKSRQFLLLWPRRGFAIISLAAGTCCSFCHNKQSKTEIESEKRVISYRAMPYALTSSFTSDGLGFYEVQKKLCGWHSSSCLSSPQVSPWRWLEPVVAVETNAS